MISGRRVGWLYHVRNMTRAGGLCLVLALPLFLLANIVAGLRWTDPAFSWADHNISDLGNVHCGVWDTTRPREVCSPWHAQFNASVLATTALLLVGMLLTWRALGRGGAVRTAQVLALVGVLGYGLVGAYPADVDEEMHLLAALLVFVAANVAPVVAGFARRGTLLGGMRRGSLVLGTVALAGTVLFLAQVDLGFGVGGMERIPVFAPLVWAAWIGATVLGTARTPGQLSRVASLSPGRGPARVTGADRVADQP